MRLIIKKSIEFCDVMWTWCTKTGKSKHEYPYTEEQLAYCKPKGLNPANDCWFCEYGYQRTKGNESACDYCPYYKKYGHCMAKDSPYRKWDHAETPRARKKSAGLFLEKIKAI